MRAKEGGKKSVLLLAVGDLGTRLNGIWEEGRKWEDDHFDQRRIE